MDHIVTMTFLTDEEIEKISGCVHRNDQIGALQKMGLIFKVNKRNEIIILRDHLKEVLSLNSHTDRPKRIEPNRSAHR